MQRTLFVTVTYDVARANPIARAVRHVAQAHPIAWAAHRSTIYGITRTHPITRAVLFAIMTHNVARSHPITRAVHHVAQAHPIARAVRRSMIYDIAQTHPITRAVLHPINDNGIRAQTQSTHPKIVNTVEQHRQLVILVVSEAEVSLSGCVNGHTLKTL